MHRTAKRLPASIRQDRKFIARFFAKVLIGSEEECWPWLGARAPKGYGKIIYRLPDLVTFQWVASRVAYTLFWGDIPDGLVVMHRCDNPPCCNPWHLKLGTPGQNTEDMVAKGRNKTPAIRLGPANHKTILNPDQVREIRTKQENRAAYARRFGVSRDAVRFAEIGVTFKYL